MSIMLPYSNLRGRDLGVGLGSFLHVIKSLFKVFPVLAQKTKSAEVLRVAHILKQFCKVSFSDFSTSGAFSPFCFSGTEMYSHQDKWTGRFILAKLPKFSGTLPIDFTSVAHHTPSRTAHPTSFCGIYNDSIVRG